MPAKVYEPLTDNVTDNITPRGSPRESSDNGSGDDDPKAMLERLEQIKSTVGTHSENDLVATTSLPVRVDPIADSQERDELMSIWAAISRIPQTNGAQAEDISDDVDPKRMLAELDSTSPSGQGTIGRHVADVVPRELFRDSQGSAPSIEKVVVDSNRSGGAVTVLDETKTPTSCASDSDPRKMLAEIEEMASCANDNNSRTMIAELERMSPSANFSLSDDDDDDLETLRGKLTNLLSASADQDLPVTASQHVQSSNNHDGSAPICNKAEVWAKAEEELNKLIEYTLREEKEYQRTETHRRLLRRLVLSNIAAGADAEDIKDFFNHHRAVM
jgi:ribosomal protein L21